MKKGNLVKLVCAFGEKQGYKCYSCSASILKDTSVLLALIDKINSPKTKRVPALILPLKAPYIEM